MRDHLGTAACLLVVAAVVLWVLATAGGWY